MFMKCKEWLQNLTNSKPKNEELEDLMEGFSDESLYKEYDFENGPNDKNMLYLKSLSLKLGQSNDLEEQALHARLVRLIDIGNEIKDKEKNGI